MPLSWNEIRQRAVAFSREHRADARERGDAQTFWNDFFHVFGKSRRAVASFEEPVKNLGGNTDFIDLFWKGRLIGESKSRGQSLDKAHSQAMGYVQSLAREGRDAELPRYLLVTDLHRIAVHDLEPTDASDLFDENADATVTFDVADLHEHVRRFAFIAGYQPQRLDPEDPANLDAAHLLANLHDRLEDGGYAGHDLQRLMVRVLFCLFAEDTGIFEPNAFTGHVTHHTAADGRDLGPQLAHLFETLNTDRPDRQRNLPEHLAEFPYVNGRLFAERLRLATFDAAMRTALLDCCRFRWETISPVVFGSLFQSVMDARDRRRIGAHYTSERDILKLVRSLFLDDLERRLNRCGGPRDYEAFVDRLASLRFLDPACGCGNFLVLAYRELRRLEMDALHRRFGRDQAHLIGHSRLSVAQFYGIELEEWPALIAEVGLWLMDHQMNNEMFARFGTAAATVPLVDSPNVRHANALAIDWNDVLPAGECSYVLGNPPFVGAKYQTGEQRRDLARVWHGVKNAGLLDYVTGWHLKAADYTNRARNEARPSGSAIAAGDVGDRPTEARTSASPIALPHGRASLRCAFVSTNSVTQGEQVGVLWPELFRRGVKIDFGHRTFPWESEARGKAHVHVVIVGFGVGDTPGDKLIHDYGPRGEPAGRVEVANVSPYLTDGSDHTVKNRSKPLSDVPPIGIGNKPIDGGHYLFTPEEREDFIREEPASEPHFRRWFGSQEFLNGIERWCLWLGDVPPQELRRMPKAMERVEAVRQYRLDSKSKPTNKLAATPTRFHVENMPSNRFLVAPKVSSERRVYMPLGYMMPDVLIGDAAFIIPDATPYHFGVLHSAMHMAWVRQVCGRLESRYRYSAKLVYNNFPWPREATAAARAKIERAAAAVLSARAAHQGEAGKGDATLADLYDPLSMPPDLSRAHAALDRAVDLCYRPQPFPDERRRFEHLFALHERLADPLTAPAKRQRRRSG